MHLNPAPDSNDPACADITVRLPQAVNDQVKRETDAQATGAWGDPVSVILSCGAAVPAASDLPCVDVEDYEWLRDATNAPDYTFTLYGRTPAVQVSVDSTRVDPGIALGTLAPVLRYTQANGLACSSLEDTVSGEPPPSGSPTP